MARLVQHILKESKSVKTQLFHRVKITTSLLPPITELQSKFQSLHRPSLSLKPLSIPWPLPINIDYQTNSNQNESDKEEQQQSHKSRTSARWKYFYRALTAYIAAELLFYGRSRYLQYFADQISVHSVRPQISHERCDELVDLALKYAALVPGGFKQWLQMWFYECDINELRAGNILELIHWGFFVEHYKPYDPTLNDPELEWREQFVRRGLHELEQRMNHKFPDGFNHRIKDRFNTKQPVQSTHRSLAFYAAISSVQMATNLALKYYFGFKLDHINGLKVWSKSIPNASKSIADREHNESANRKRALMFLHGIGIGIGPYCLFLRELLSENARSHSLDMLCLVEIPNVTVDIAHLLPWPLSSASYITSKVPAATSDYIQVLHEMERRMNSNEANDLREGMEWTLLGHSYGSMIASSMYCQIANPQQRPRLVLVDPACFCLSHPSAVAAFVTDIDRVADNDDAMPALNARKVLAKELMISCNLRRYFHWYDVVLYPEDMVDGKTHCVVTSDKDNFVPVQLIEKGIRIANEERVDSCGESLIRHNTMNVGHGEWIWDKQCIRTVIDAL